MPFTKRYFVIGMMILKSLNILVSCKKIFTTFLKSESVPGVINL